MKNILGIGLIILGVILGLYVGVWLCFIGGIRDIVDVVNIMIKNDFVDGLKLAIGIVKIIFAGVAGYLSALFCIILGRALME